MLHLQGSLIAAGRQRWLFAIAANAAIANFGFEGLFGLGGAEAPPSARMLP
jgi:hypothetical protein